jgi:hypothetical protein
MLHLRTNQMVLSRTVWGALRNTDWARAWKKDGVWGVLVESVAALSGQNSWPFFMDARTPWSPEMVAGLLHSHRVIAWGWGYAGGEYYWRVKLRQARRAEVLLLQHGVPLTGQLLTSEEDMRRNGAAATAEGAPARTFDTLGVIDRLIDRVADV